MTAVSNEVTAPSGGYYGPGYRETATTHDRHRLNEYIAGFKHALLFMPKLVIADHMVVNAPNFRIAYHTDETFRGLFRGEFVELAHFERHIDGPHFSLVELRRFYEKRRFHANVLQEFRSARFDRELEQIQAQVPMRLADSARRDPRFTELAVAALDDNGELKSLFGRLYSVYEESFRRMLKNNPVLGIIHFDPERSFPGIENIFDFMAKVGTAGTREQLIAQYGADVGRAHRALIVRSEIELLDDLHAILPPELDKYRTWVRRSASENFIDPVQREEIVKDIDLHAVSTEALVSLSLADIVELRGSDPAIRYFQALEKAFTGESGFSELVADLEGYIQYLNAYFFDRAFATKTPRKQQDRLRVLRGIARGKTARDAGLATMFQIAAWSCFHWFAFIPAVALAQAGKIAGEGVDKMMPEPVTDAPAHEIRARMELTENEREALLQYE